MHKLKMLADFSLAQRYLHPCIYALRNNCCQCEKCIRTEVVLYGFGALERFDTVFDIEGFEENKRRTGWSHRIIQIQHTCHPNAPHFIL